MSNRNYIQHSSNSKRNVFVECAFCKVNFGPHLPGQAKRMKYCSRSCSSKAKVYWFIDGHWVEPHLHCKVCGKKCRKDRNRSYFCSRKCSRSHTAMVQSECCALKRIGINASPAYRYKRSLSKISRARDRARIRLERLSTCIRCGGDKDRITHRVGLCSICIKESKRRWRNSESAKKIKRASKAARRIRVRENKGYERVDPYDVFDRYGWKCYICGIDTPVELRGLNVSRSPELDHIHPISRGGSHSMDNLACCCRRCNILKSNRTIDEMRAGGNYHIIWTLPE